jgi:hypothetical protein
MTYPNFHFLHITALQQRFLFFSSCSGHGTSFSGFISSEKRGWLKERLEDISIF